VPIMGRTYWTRLSVDFVCAAAIMVVQVRRMVSVFFIALDEGQR
jgi:hypothetical protein